MKNTKHTEMNDSSIEQDNQENLSQSKRKILTSIGVTSGVVGASALVPSTWVKPAVNSVILPAHAGTTPMMTTAEPGDMMTTTMEMEPTTTMEMEMTTTMAAGPMINVMGYPTSGMVGDGSAITYHVSLSQAPTTDPDTGLPGMVMVTAESDPDLTVAYSGEDGATSLIFTTANYGMAQTLTVTTVELLADSEPDVTVTFTASSGGYDDVEATAEFTVVDNDIVPVTGLMADGSAGMLTVSWTAPATTKSVVRYIVQTSRTVITEITIPTDNGTTGTGDAAIHTFNTSSTSHTFDLAGKPGDYHYAVQAVFVIGEGETVPEIAASVDGEEETVS